jgi:hypothetical protein
MHREQKQDIRYEYRSIRVLLKVMKRVISLSGSGLVVVGSKRSRMASRPSLAFLSQPIRHFEPAIDYQCISPRTPEYHIIL